MSAPSESSPPCSPSTLLPDLPHTATRPFRFTWDPASKKGPASISETTTDGRAQDTFTALPRVHLPTVASPLPPHWSSTTQGFNGMSSPSPYSLSSHFTAVSNVLNNPRKRHAPPKAHSPLPPVPPTDLPRVKRKDFDSYLRAIAPEWDRFLQGASPPPAQSDSPSLPPPTPRLAKLLTPLNTVPSVFFNPDFDLTHPRIFDAVTERVHGDQDSSDPSSLSYSLPLLEKLSHHADTIEQHLVREISLRSTSFFAALTNLQDLQTESEQCLDRISKLRTLLNDLDNNTAIRGLHIVRKESRRSNLVAVNNAVRDLAAVVEMSSVAGGLVGAGQWGEALVVIDTIQSLFHRSPQDTPVSLTPIVERRTRPPDDAPSPLPPTLGSPPLEIQAATKSSPRSSVPLSLLAAFISLPSHLQAMNTQITSSLTTDLVTALKLDLLDRVSANSDVSHSVTNPDLTMKDILRPLLQGLLRTNGIREAIVSWREVVMSEVRGIMKRVGATSFSSEKIQSLTLLPVLAIVRSRRG